MEAGLRYCASNVDFYQEMLEAFSDGSEENLNRLNESYLKKDWQEYQIVSHTLKSTSKTIGAKEFANLAKAMEDAVTAGRLDELEAHHEEFLENYQKLTDDIRKTLA